MQGNLRTRFTAIDHAPEQGVRPRIAHFEDQRGFAGFGGVWVCSRDSRSAAAGRRWLIAAAVLVVTANILARSPLMDGEAERFTGATRALLYLPFLAGGVLALVDGWRTGGDRVGPDVLR